MSSEIRTASRVRQTWQTGRTGALVALLALSACAADQPSGSESSEDEAADDPQAELYQWSWPWGSTTRDAGTRTTGNDPSRPVATPQMPTISSTGTFTGSLCNTNKDIDSSSGAFTAHIDAPLDNGENQTGSAKGSCSASLNVTTAKGFQIVGPFVCTRVILQGPEDDAASARVTLRVSFGNGEVATKTQALKGSRAFAVCGAFPQVKTGCDANQGLNAKLNVTVDLEAGPETFAQVSSIDGDLT